jgi:hypothetical protein
MSERLYHYSVIRYVPRPLAEEFVNVGVVAVSDKGDEAAVEFTDDWTRARALGGREDDILMLRRLARAWTDESFDLPLFHEASDDDGFARLNRLYESSANNVQFSRPHRGFASNVDRIVDEVYDSLIASAPKVLTRRAPSRAKSTSRTTRARESARRWKGTIGRGRASTAKAPTAKRAAPASSGTRKRGTTTRTTVSKKRTPPARTAASRKRAASKRKPAKKGRVSPKSRTKGGPSARTRRR